MRKSLKSPLPEGERTQAPLGFTDSGGCTLFLLGCDITGLLEKEKQYYGRER